MASIYKQASHTLRQVNTETNYGRGMFFVNTPLTEGFSKLLVNFDFVNGGASLSPRRGLRTTKIIRPGASEGYTITACNTTTHLNPDRKAGYSDAFRRVDQVVMDYAAQEPLAFDTDDAGYFYIKTNVDHYQNLSMLQCFPEGVDSYASFYGENASADLKALHKLSYWYPLLDLSKYEYHLRSKQFLNNKNNAQNTHLMTHDCPLVDRVLSPTGTKHLNKPGFVGVFAWDDNLIYPVLRYNNNYTFIKSYICPGHPVLDAKWITLNATDAGPEDFYTPEPADSVFYLILTAGAYYGTLVRPVFNDTTFTGWKVVTDGDVSFACTRLNPSTKITSPLSTSDQWGAEEETIVTNPAPVYYFKMFNKNEGSTKALEPKTLTPAEAVQWGYNMLATNPYMFESRTASEGVAQILGVLPYYTAGENAELALKALVGEQVYFKIFCACAPTTTDYIVRLSIRNLTSSEFTTVYEKHHTGTELSQTITTALPHTIAFEQFIMKAEIVQPIPPVQAYIKEDYPYGEAMPAVYDGPYTEYWLTDLDGGTIEPQKDVIYHVLKSKMSDSTLVHFDEYASKTYRWSGVSYFENPYEKQENQIHTSVVSFDFSKTRQNNSSALIKLPKYTIAACSGMTYWRNRLVVWGVPEDPTILFLSDINDPAYFPYPNNISTFNEPILKAVPFNDSLLVFTATRLWQLVLNTDGLTWTQTCLQNNLKITEADTALILTTNTMVFFKSGNYYYMMVPSTKTVGSLVLAPISKPIEKFFDSFSDNIAQLMMSVYKLDIKNKSNKNLLQTSVDGVDPDYKGACYLRRFALAQHTVELLHEDICINYTFYAEESDDYYDYVTVSLRYNTASRTWRIYVTDTPAPYRSVSRSSVGEVEYICPFTFTEHERSWYHNSYYSWVGIQYLKFEATSCADALVDNNSIFTDAWQTAGPSQVIIGSAVAVPAGTALIEGPSLFNNWQLLDTGNREQLPELKKRYRGCRLSLNNLSPETLQFSLEFMVDNEVRVPMYVPTCSITDGVATLQYEANTPLSTALVMAGRVQLTDSDTDPDYTRIYVGTEGSGSVFTYPYVAKIFTSVSGKGYAPRLKLLSKNTVDYELLSHDWVFRTMNAR